MPFIRSLLIALTLSGLPLLCAARDLPKADPTRQALLDSVRNEPDMRFIVKDMFQTGDFAYLCALETDKQGNIYGTDDALDVNQWVFLRHKGVWYPQSLGGGFAASTAKVDCSVATAAGPDGLPGTDEDFKALWAAQIQQGLLGDLDFGKRTRLDPNLQAALKAHNLLRDFAIDHGRDRFDPVQASVAGDRCGKDKPCRQAVQQHFANLNSLSQNQAVSSLVWENCKFGLRIADLGVIEQCVRETMPKPYCRPGMYYYQHEAQIQRCLADIRSQCQSLVKDEAKRSIACSG